jgi:hypothetical protein
VVNDEAPSYSNGRSNFVGILLGIEVVETKSEGLRLCILTWCDCIKSRKPISSNSQMKPLPM